MESLIKYLAPQKSKLMTTGINYGSRTWNILRLYYRFYPLLEIHTHSPLYSACHDVDLRSWRGPSRKISYQSHHSTAATHAEEALSSVRTAQAFAAEDKLAQLYDASLTSAQKVGYKKSVVLAAMFAAVYSLIFLAYGLAFCNLHPTLVVFVVWD
jgi:ABC-type transport system involved in Fe-S cluster assembly fused permease/ATPase subunit